MPAAGESLDTLSRRTFLRSLSGAAGILAVGRWNAAVDPDRIDRIETAVVWNGRGADRTWFHPRACLIPAAEPLLLMTLQPITGSDVFGPVHCCTSKDLGRTWSDPKPIPGLGRRAAGEGNEEGVCDVVPEYHAATGTVLAMGHNVHYQRGVLARPQRARWPVYVVRDADGEWSPPRKLVWGDPRATAIYTCGCGQRLTRQDGDILVPLSFGAVGQTARSVCTVRCTFDGEALAVRECGNALSNPVGRGLLEPSLAAFDGRVFMTLRAEDGRGYASAAEDGLQWAEPTPWCWENGTPLEMSTTQQHWLPHASALYLVYTRKAEKNVNVFRWRSPLFTARVDPDSLRLVRSTEKVVLPLIGDGIDDPTHVARMGNFHTVAVSAAESLVTVGECLPDDGWKGDSLVARVRWK